MTSTYAQGEALSAQSTQTRTSGTILQRRALPPQPAAPIADEAQALQLAEALAAEFATGAAERDRQRLLPWDEIERYSASGLLAITVPRQYGGLGASYETLAQLFVTICTADPSLGQIPQNHFAVLQNLQDIGSEAQKERWFADVLAGHRIGNAGPELKERAAQMTTATASLQRDEQGRLRLSGTRFYSTGSAFAHWIPLRAQDEQGRPVQVWVRREAPGVTVHDDWDAFGQRTTASGSVSFDQVVIGDEDVLPVWRHADIPNLSGPVSQLIQAAIDAGIARAALRDAVDFVREKARPWMDSGVGSASADPYIIGEVGQLHIEIEAAHAVLLEAARTLDRLARQPIDARASAQASVAEAKILTTEAALHASEQLIALAGSASTRAAHNLDRHWRNARVHTLHDPVRWKYHLLGNYLLNDVLPRRHQWN